MKSKPLAVALLGIGIACLLIGPWVPTLTPTEVVWTDAQAEGYAKASADLHNALHQSSGQRKSLKSLAHEDTFDLRTAQAKFDSQESLLQGARNRVQFYKYLCQGLGVLLAVSGVAMYLHLRMTSDEE